jgi:hypothetical protein
MLCYAAPSPHEKKATSPAPPARGKGKRMLREVQAESEPADSSRDGDDTDDQNSQQDVSHCEYHILILYASWTVTCADNAESE